MRRMVVTAMMCMMAVITLASVTAAAGLGDLTVSSGSTDVWYNITVPEYYQGPPPYQGSITQYGVSKGTVYYSLPKITFTDKQFSVFGVCVDLDQYTGSPAELRRGWERNPSAPTLNGTVKDFTAWEHTTYLFNKHYADLASWWGTDKNKCAAFQLSIWEVMSGDGSEAGGTWATGNFTADNVVSSIFESQANLFVAEAYDTEFGKWQDSASARSVLYMHDHQDLLVAPPVVPEIPAALLAPLGLSLVALIRRKIAR